MAPRGRLRDSGRAERTMRYVHKRDNSRIVGTRDRLGSHSDPTSYPAEFSTGAPILDPTLDPTDGQNRAPTN